MPLSKFAMIIKGPGYAPEIHRACLASTCFSTAIVGVSSFEQALLAAQQLAQDGVQLIELCGGFSPEEAETLKAALTPRIPVGVVRYTDEEQAQLAALFA